MTVAATRPPADAPPARRTSTLACAKAGPHWRKDLPTTETQAVEFVPVPFGAAEARAPILEILRGLALAGFGVGGWLPVRPSMSDEELQGLISAARAQHAHHPPPPSPHKLRAESPKHVNVEIEEAGEDGVIAHV